MHPGSNSYSTHLMAESKVLSIILPWCLSSVRDVLGFIRLTLVLHIIAQTIH